MNASWLSRNLLRVDGLAGAMAGALVLSLSGWFSDLYLLPRNLLTTIGLANLVYGSYSLSLSARERRPKALILLLVAANSVWAFLCLRWFVAFRGEASVFGLAHFVGEAFFVGGLAFLEWRWRDDLLLSSRKGEAE